jgi:excisionase family DNA binding protein
MSHAPIDTTEQKRNNNNRTPQTFKHYDSRKGKEGHSMKTKAKTGRPRKDLKQTITAAPIHENYYTVTEAAQLLGVHRHTIQARLRDGTIKGKLIGNQWRIYKNELYTNA